MVDYRTHEYYQHHVAEVVSRYNAVSSPIQPYFASAFKACGRILDVGCGSGRDLQALLSDGFDAYGIEPADAMRDRIRLDNPVLAQRIYAGSLPGLVLADLPPSAAFDGILCSAVLMHIPAADLLESLINLRELLTVGGRLLISVPANRDDLGDDHRDAYGRLFLPLEPERLQLLLSQLGFSTVSQWQSADSLGRGGVSWHLLLFEKQAAGARPLDRIESVLKRDRKVATYKLALLRSFCDMAERDRQAVSWLPDGMVGMPLRPLAECWLRYYWPLIASPLRIPQSRTDTGASRPIAFRAELTTLIQLSQTRLDAVHNPELAYVLLMLGLKRRTLHLELLTAYHKTIRKIEQTMREGPIEHAEQGDMFRWDKQQKLVLVESALWREFCLSGYWIRDSLILRWAELSEGFATGLPQPLNRGQILPFLFLQEDIEREQAFARGLYQHKSRWSVSGAASRCA